MFKKYKLKIKPRHPYYQSYEQWQNETINECIERVPRSDCFLDSWNSDITLTVVSKLALK